MKTKQFILICISIALSVSSCKKEDSGGTIFSSAFDNTSDLNLWTQSADGEAVIEQDYLKLKAIAGCFVFETADLIYVREGKTYTFKFKDYLIQEGFGDYTQWTQKSFSFEAPSSAGVKIRFLIGTEKGAWLDNLELIEN